MAWLTTDQILQIPSEKLGLLILHRLTQLPENNWGRHNFAK
jgi:hypothetical protein